MASGLFIRLKLVKIYPYLQKFLYIYIYFLLYAIHSLLAPITIVRVHASLLGAFHRLIYFNQNYLRIIFASFALRAKDRTYSIAQLI